MRILLIETILSCAVCSLGGCGTQVPDMSLTGEKPLEETFSEIDLVNQIKCEIHLGTREALRVWKSGSPTSGNGVEWLRDWEAKVSLKLTVDDTTALNAGISLTNPLQNAITHFATNGNVISGQAFTGNIGVQASAESTRVETLAFTFHLDDLLKYDPLRNSDKDCRSSGGIPILDTLKINEFIVTKSGVAASPDAVPNTGKISPFTVFSYQSTFVLILSGNLTPVWKFVRITSSSTTPLFNDMRKRTQDISITMGPRNSKEVAAVYQAQIFAQAFAASLAAR